MLNFVNFFIYWFERVVYHTDWLLYIESSLQPRDNIAWSWRIILLPCCWIRFARMSIEDFCICFHQKYWPVITFFICCHWLALESGWCWHHKMHLGMFPLLIYYGKIYEEIVSILWSFDRIHPWRHLVWDFS